MSKVSSAIRREVQRRANGRCEYCLIPETSIAFSFHVEHIRPLKHGGSSEMENLAWSCFACNVAKGTDIVAYDFETGDIVQLFNPRLQKWADHFEMNGAQILGKPPIGRASAKLLQLNHSRQVEAREQLIEAGLW